MRVCPKCGYEDAPCWRPGAYHQEHSYSQIDVLEMFEPELWEAIKNKDRGELIEIPPFVFWKSTRSDTVRRCWIEDFKMVGKRGSPQERTTKKSPGQWTSRKRKGS